MVVSEYADRGISGTTGNRPEFQRMLAAASAGEFDVLIVDDLSRLSRNQADTLRTIGRLTFDGIRIIAVSDGFDTASKSYKVQAGVRGLINDIYIDDLKEKTHRGLTGRALDGGWVSVAPYGYQNKRDDAGRPRLEVVPDQADVVRDIFERYASGWSPRKIAAALNQRKIVSPRGGYWRGSAILGRSDRRSGILACETYVGRLHWNRSTWQRDPDTGRRRRSARPESEWIVTEQPELRVVDDALWEAAQRRQRQERHLTEGARRNGRTSAGA